MPLVLAILGAGLLAALAAAPAPAAGPDGSTFALVPQHYDPSLRATQSYFVSETAPGISFKNAVIVRNLGKRAGTAYLYAVDAATGRTSGAVYLDRTKPRHGVGAWIHLGTKSVTLGPGESKIVPVSVHVPANARPGDHLGGIVAENAAVTGSKGKGSLKIRVRHLTIAAVEVQVPGAATARVRVLGVRAAGEHGYQYVYLHLKSTGTLTTKPSGLLLIRDSNGKQVASRTFKLDTFLPGTQIDYPVLLPRRALVPGPYTAAVKLTYAATALGYRRQAGPSYTTIGGYPFEVTANEYKIVFSGSNPLAAPKQPQPHQGSSGSTILLVLAGALGALLVVAVVLVVAVRRWPQR